MTQHPMKVSEAVQNIRMRMRQGILGADDYDDLSLAVEEASK